MSNAASANGTNLWLASKGGAMMGHWESNILTVEPSYTSGNSELLSDTVLAIALDKAGYLMDGYKQGPERS